MVLYLLWRSKFPFHTDIPVVSIKPHPAEQNCEHTIRTFVSVLNSQVYSNHAVVPQVSDEDVDRLLACPNSHDVSNFSDFRFSPRSLPWEEMACYTLLMFTDLELDDLFNIKRKTLAR
jgi:hypothetical protein